ncbi:MAG: hypothetical protein U1C74_12215 [Phenylobacterium sp.]|nr:hypothetical protein [Phenylobacterium sp.]
MTEASLGAILVVCNDEAYASDLIGKLHESGASVVGPVTRANMALALAAQSTPDMAIVTHPLTGRRDAEELARALHDTWGVRSLVLDEALSGAQASGEQPWLPTGDDLTRLRRVLGTVGEA